MFTEMFKSLSASSTDSLWAADQNAPIRERHFNRPFPSSKTFHFQNEAKCETFVVEMSFNYDANKTHFHNKGFALSLVLKVKLFGTRKWPIACFPRGQLKLNWCFVILILILFVLKYF